MDFREVFVYTLVALCSLFLSAYAVHMVIGGLVPEEIEYRWMGLVCAGVAIVIVAMARDVLRNRK
jgi:hypothetical protein